MRISDWSSDVCSSDLEVHAVELQLAHQEVQAGFLELADERCPGGGQLAGRDAVVVGRAGAAVGLVQIGQAQQLPDDVIQLLVQVDVGPPQSAQPRHARLQHDQIGRASCRERVCQYV